MNDLGARLSTLWVVVMFNMVFADILSFLNPGALEWVWSGQAGVVITPTLLVVFAVLIEIPIAMIYLSRTLRPAARRWANTAAAAITTAFVVGGSTPAAFYWFFAVAEIVCMAAIVWLVWAQRSAEKAPSRMPVPSA